MVAQTLRDLHTKYVDLVLLHYPECWGTLCEGKPEGTWQDSWAALEELAREGSVRAIGVSNFNVGELDQLLKLARVKPALVQSNSGARGCGRCPLRVWGGRAGLVVREGGGAAFLPPLRCLCPRCRRPARAHCPHPPSPAPSRPLRRADLLRADAPVQAFCRKHGITFQGYSTLGGQWLAQAQGRNPVVGHSLVAELADRHGKTPGQVVLRWALQHGQVRREGRGRGAGRSPVRAASPPRAHVWRAARPPSLHSLSRPAPPPGGHPAHHQAKTAGRKPGRVQL